MVSPVILLVVALLSAFLYPLVERIGRRVAFLATLLLSASFVAVALSWVVGLSTTDVELLIADTAGFPAPLSINLAVGLTEALVLTVIALIGTLGVISGMTREDEPWKGRQIVLFFVLMLGAFGLLMSQDLFNIFVFMEISGISVFGLLGTSRDTRAFEGGFKYMIASGLASAFFLVGVAFIYYTVGSLNIADIVSGSNLIVGMTGVMALVFLAAGILIELKPAPANGWALDTYQAADPALGALISGVNATAMAVVFSRLMPIFTGAAGAVFTPLFLIAGVLAFLIPQFQGLMQDNLRRMLGYSSVAQIGLVVIALSVLPEDVRFGMVVLPAAIVLLLNHALAKAGLFWVVNVIGDEKTGFDGRWPHSIRMRKRLSVFIALLVFALLGLPPFPGFWAKWNLVQSLGGTGMYAVLAVVLAGSLLEAVYLMRWYVGLVRGEGDDVSVTGEHIPADFSTGEDETSVEGGGCPDSGCKPALACAGMSTLLLVVGGLSVAWSAGFAAPSLLLIPVILLLAIVDAVQVPMKLQTAASIAVVAGALYMLAPFVSGIRLLFAGLFGIGGAVQLVAFFNRSERAPGLVPLTAGLILTLMTLTAAPAMNGATGGLELFFLWELLAVISFALVLQGRKGGAAALRFIIFSLGGAYLMLASLALPDNPLMAGQAASGTLPTAQGVWAIVLFAGALLTKLGSAGVHVWLPPSYAETADDVSAIVSSVLSKAAVFLLFVGGTAFTAPLFGSVQLMTLVGWLGVVTAVVGAMMALFQEDAKYLLAYSSMSQIGYIVLAFAVMSHLGWVGSLYLTVTHLLFKGILFLAVAGVIHRTGTRLMYQMGGLIKRMPWSFVSVLIGIIAVSGVPPLTGFGGKWLLYTALLEKGWYLQAALAMFSSGVAFLYLFRLIHTIFLGQRKAKHHTLREAPLALLIPQYLFIVIIMVFSMFPNMIILPLQAVVESVFPSTVAWDGYSVISALGYWNGNAVMYVTMGVFLAPLLWLLLVKGRVYRVEQFNIVYAAERPHTPESTHYAFNFYGHYRKAFGRALDPWAERFWASVSATGASIGRGLRGWNTGNPQTYALQIILYVLLIVFIAQGGV